MIHQQLKDEATNRGQLAEMELVDLRSQVADLMKHLEVQSAIGNTPQDLREDIQGGQMFTEQTSPESPSKRRGGARPKR